MLVIICSGRYLFICFVSGAVHYINEDAEIRLSVFTLRYISEAIRQYDSKSLNLYDTASLPQRISGYPLRGFGGDFIRQIPVASIPQLFVSINLSFFNSAAK